MCVYIYTYVYLHIYMCIFLPPHTCIRMHVHTCTHTYIITFHTRGPAIDQIRARDMIYTFIHTHIHTYIRMNHTYIHEIEHRMCCISSVYNSRCVCVQCVNVYVYSVCAVCKCICIQCVNVYVTRDTYMYDSCVCMCVCVCVYIHEIQHRMCTTRATDQFCAVCVCRHIHFNTHKHTHRYT